MKQPRFCTLFDETIDVANVISFSNTESHVANNFEISVCRYIQDDNCFQEYWFTYDACTHGIDIDLMVMQAIIQAKNPLLDLAHALEMAYKFNHDLCYVWTAGKGLGELKPPRWTLNGDTLIDSYDSFDGYQGDLRTRHKAGSIGFQILNKNGSSYQHGDPESSIKAWEEKKHGD
jgi:hypothetical protein